jgi:16S rRNA (guanine527-N7)-methyltransferase
MTASDRKRRQLPHIDGPAAFAAAFDVAPETTARLVAYADCLALWQPRINLVGPATLPDVWHRHFADSAQILDLVPTLPAGALWADLGSGGGFPGLVIAILLAGRPPPHPRIVLVESDQRKCAFLAEVVRRTGIAPTISVDILAARIESDSTRVRVATADVVSARALAPLEKLLGLAAPMLGSRSVCLFLKGRGVETELAAARQAWQFSCEIVPSRTDAEAQIVRLEGAVVRRES